MSTQYKKKKSLKNRRKRSVSLSAYERELFKLYAESFDTLTDCAAELGFSREIPGQLMRRGSGNSVTIAVVRKHLEKYGKENPQAAKHANEKAAADIKAS